MGELSRCLLLLYLFETKCQMVPTDPTQEEAMPQRSRELSMGGVGGAGVQGHRLALPSSRAATFWALLCCCMDRTL